MRYFHVDVIKRSSQNILTVKDHFSTYQDAMLIPSEKAEDLKQGIIMLTSGMRHPNMIQVSPDNSPGFQNLTKNKDKDLIKLKITFVKTDELNKNANAVIDRGCQELEDEIKKISPEGEKLTQSSLKLAILSLNSKLRRRGTVSAYEINSSRDQNTGEQLAIDDEKLRSNQLQTRKIHQDDSVTAEPVLVGDTVSVKNRTDKHKANDIFLVTSKTEDTIKVQKLLHPLAEKPGKIMSKTYETNEKRVKTIHRPEYLDVEDDDETVPNDCEELMIAEAEESQSWSPVNKRFFMDDDSEDDSDCNSIETLNVNDNTDEPCGMKSEPVSELEWDNSPEQYALHSSDNSEAEILEAALKPRRLFPEDSTDTLTSDASGEVFNTEDMKIVPGTSRLRRQNAFRRKLHPPITLTVSTSVPRDAQVRQIVTRSSLRRSVSVPNTPTDVQLHQAQLLARVLPIHDPVVPEVVQLGPQVQRLDRALRHHQVEVNLANEAIEANEVNEVNEADEVNRRPRRATRSAIDYAKFDETGEKQ